MRLKILFFLLAFLLIPVSAYAKKNTIFSNQAQQQALDSLSNILDDAKRMNLRRSSQSIHLTINRIQTAIQFNRALGNARIKATPQNAYRPYAFIQSATDRSKLIKNLNDLSNLHQQYKRALQTKNTALQKQLKRSFFQRSAKIRHIKFRWRTKIGKIGLLQKRNIRNNKVRVCRNLLPHEKYYSQWESCCDIGKNKSRWLKRSTNKVNNWKGSCRSWGLQ